MRASALPTPERVTGPMHERQLPVRLMVACVGAQWTVQATEVFIPRSSSASLQTRGCPLFAEGASGAAQAVFRGMRFE